MGLEAEIFEARYPIWVYLVLFVMAALLAVLFGTYREQTRKLLLASINQRSKAELDRSDSEIIARVGRLMNLLFFMGLFLALFVLDRQYQLFPFQGIGVIFQIIGFIVLFFGGKYFMNLFLGLVFQSESEARFYLQDTYLKYRLYGVFMFPALLVIMFSKTLSNIAFVLALLGFILVVTAKSFHGVRIGLLSKSFPKHYSFLYICTLEILPLLIVYKIFEGPIRALIK